MARLLFLVLRIFVILILRLKKHKRAYTPGVHSSLSFRIPGVSGQALPETALSRIATQWAVWKKDVFFHTAPFLTNYFLFFFWFLTLHLKS